jgi:hypothetical protein
MATLATERSVSNKLPDDLRKLVFTLAGEHRKLSRWARQSAAGKARRAILDALPLDASTGDNFKRAWAMYCGVVGNGGGRL